jgi:hypothetical protein
LETATAGKATNSFKESDMAGGEWVKWTKGLEEKPEVIFMAARLGREPEEIAGRLMKLWRWCDDHITENDIDARTMDVTILLGDQALTFVDRKLGLTGMAELMTSPEVRWLTVRSGGRITFPKLAHHNLKPAKVRAQDARRKQSRSHHSGSQPEETGNRGRVEEEVNTTPVPADLETRSRVLAERFVFWWPLRKSGGGVRTPLSSIEMQPQFAEYLRCRGSFDAAMAEIEDPGRNRNEWPGDLLKRLMAQRSDHGRNGKRRHVPGGDSWGDAKAHDGSAVRELTFTDGGADALAGADQTG